MITANYTEKYKYLKLEYTINSEDLAPGIYIVELSEKKMPIGRQKLVIQ